MMSYKSALEAAGAKVLAMQYFGSYQGDWLAKVVFDGETGWVAGSFGSCSYCDGFQREFDYCYEDETADYQERLRLFGLGYLSALATQEQQEAICKRQLPADGECDWGDFQLMYDFVVASR
jgi:hypothetical protein